jgi:hypothetical protein
VKIVLLPAVCLLAFAPLWMAAPIGLAFENLHAPPPPAVPEPAALAMVGFGLSAVAASLRRRKKIQ